MDSKYKLAELEIYWADLKRVESAPLVDRQAARGDFLEYLSAIKAVNYAPLYERVSWIFNGSYGSGALLAWNNMSKRSNRRAWCFITIAALDHQVTNSDARKIWNSLDTKTQDAINAGLDKEIAENDRDRADGTAAIA